MLRHLRRNPQKGVNSGENSGFGYSARADAVRADAHALMSFPVEHANTLKVRIPAPPRQIMGVAHPVSINRAFVADFTARHEGNLP